MANDLNLCQFIGRLGQDPEVKYTPNGKAHTTISLACGQSWKDKDTGEKKEKTEWVRVIFWGKLAEIVGEYLSKGKQVYVSGRMQTRKWQDRDGNDRYTTEVVADTMQMLGSRGEQQAPTRASPPSGGQPSRPQPADDFDDDIPF